MRICVLLGLLSVLSVTATSAVSQAIGLLQFNARTRLVDRVPAVLYDTTLQRSTTGFFRGHTNKLTVLSNRLPTTNALPNTQFSLRQRAAVPFNPLSYPLSTTVRITNYRNGVATGSGSGTLVGERFVLTAAHNVVVFNGSLLVMASDSVLIEPVFDNGRPARLPTTWGYKYYVPNNYDENYNNDLCLLELAAPIGRTTGWMSIGFNKDRSTVGQHVWHKFSYPVRDISGRASYNGDTLYYEYGQAQTNRWLPYNIVIPNHFDGASGQSGSSLFITDNATYWTIYGALTFYAGFEHTGISPATYHAFSSIMRAAPINGPVSFVCYPNPVQDFLFVQVPVNKPGLVDAKLYDAIGRVVTTGQYSPLESEFRIDLSGVLPGIYVLHLSADYSRQSFKILKQ
ncbi:T9SS type A sorting domain-containing protein [Hymenobacter sp. BT186]|uniref:T9SS type A sorting domain-containing protein n=1 Tax=Hymenobacter telluris TaxID=2816474 RepID=A0A939EWU8_9BACT|nr:T9SS type A sorting domain-containing protein [Hymenobacter telluris]MBO0358965.1 T9SS type A sorting domain-containing protein [Hymenobacter telluris]MBW3374991.1 T9SS type A sorting domain-containing protein [Hymenobacter norwichensis]